MNHKSTKHKDGSSYSGAFHDKYRQRYDGTVATPKGGTLLGSNGKPMKKVNGTLRNSK